MSSKLNPKQKLLYDGIDKILWHDWDPIGISETGCPRNEYDCCLPRVFQITLESSDPKPISDYLEWAAVDHMGLQSNLSVSTAVAIKILTLKVSIGL